MAKRQKKPFFKTGVGSVLKGVASIVAPGLVQAIETATDLPSALEIIKGSDEPPEVKFRLQELALEQYQAEVADRVAARQREAVVAAAGGSDILFKVVGFGITIAFLIIVAGAMGAWDIPDDHQRMYDMAFGAVVAKMTAIVSYYFGSSMGSKQKTNMMNGG